VLKPEISHWRTNFDFRKNKLCLIGPVVFAPRTKIYVTGFKKCSVGNVFFPLECKLDVLLEVLFFSRLANSVN
jgi:hypothetical protein